MVLNHTRGIELVHGPARIPLFWLTLVNNESGVSSGLINSLINGNYNI